MSSIRLELTGELGRLEAALGRGRAIGAKPEPLLRQIGASMESGTQCACHRTCRICETDGRRQSALNLKSAVYSSDSAPSVPTASILARQWRRASRNAA